ncbi:MAG: hypothetical protein WBX11_09135 [Thiobacillaceae bacterium]|jgi:hypothetical protein
MPKPSRFIASTPDNLSLGIADDKDVILKLLGLEDEAGLVPRVGMNKEQMGSNTIKP